MKDQRESQRKFVEGLFAGLRTPPKDIERLQALEKAGKREEFARARIALDKQQELRVLKGPEGVDPAKINAAALRPATDADRVGRDGGFRAGIDASLIAQLLESEKVRCECLIPFTFQGLRAYTAMSGPDLSDVRNGVLGAIRLNDSEYTVSNPGNTTGTTRVPLAGQLYIEFAATLPSAGRHCLLMPTGTCWAHGHTRVVGHGNSTTSYDAKVWVRRYLVLVVGNTLLEMSGGQVHYDGTRSEDRTTFFNADFWMAPRYVFFQASAGDRLSLTLRLEVDTEANEDGIAIGVTDAFGFPANTKSDYDSFVIKSG